MARKRLGLGKIPLGICKHCGGQREVTDGHLPSGPAGPFCATCWDLLRADEADHLANGRPIKGTVCADENCLRAASVHFWLGSDPYIHLLVCPEHAAVAQAINDKAEAAR